MSKTIYKGSEFDDVEYQEVEDDKIVTKILSVNEQARLLKEYTERIQPGHLMITEADIIRYMILHFDVEAARKDFFIK